MKKLFICVLVILSVGLGSYAYFRYLLSKDPGSAPQASSTETPVKGPETAAQDTPVKPKPNVVYDIRGKSNKLTAKEWDAMQKSRLQTVEIAKQNLSEVFINGFTEEKICALSFDDGPDGIITPKILDTLKNAGINASFFVIGNQVKQYKNVVKRASDEGNLVLNHSFTHPDFLNMNAENIKKQLSETEDMIYNITGKRPAILRPPYGSLNDTIISTSKASGYSIVIWSTDTLDWSQKDKDNIVKNVIDNIRPGEIILMHCNDDKKATAEALPIIISELKAKGYSFVTLDKLLDVPAYK